MQYHTILVRRSSGIMTITLNRPAQRNTLNLQVLDELSRVLDEAEQDSECKMVVLAGQNGLFCTGMDFEAALSEEGEPGYKYMDTLKRLSLIPKVIVSSVDGQVTAGGVGLAAASDLVISTSRSQFSLSEALWGLLPAMVIPYLIRRVGFQKAYSMTLTTLPVPAREALTIHLVDELSEEPDKSIQRLWQRLGKVETSTIGNIKRYFREMWIITERLEETAVMESSRRMADPGVREKIENFIKYNTYPWEKQKPD